MELSRLSRVLRDRWMVIVVVAVTGFLAGWYFTKVATERGVTPVQASITIRFEPEDGEDINSVSERINTALETARFAAGDLLLADPDSSIEVDPTSTGVVFTAVGSTRGEALDQAEAMLQAFQEIDPRFGGDVQDELDRVLALAEGIDAQIEEIRPAPGPEAQALEAEYAFIDQQIAAATAALVDLRIQLAIADEQRSEIEGDIAQLETTLQGLTTERAALPPLDTGDLTTSEQFRLTTLENARTALLAQYETLLLRQMGIASVGQVEPPVVTELPGRTLGPVVNGLIGSVGGLILAVMGVVFLTRIRKPVWLPEDVDIPVVADVPNRRVGTNPATPWYDGDQGSPRKVAVQALRSVVEVQLPPSGGSLAIAGDEVHPASLHALAADLATSMASAGASVLLVDADFVGDVSLGEYRVGGPSLSEALRLDPDRVDLNQAIDGLLHAASPIRPGLAVIPTGPRLQSPGDALAGRQFRAFIDRATDRFDVVVVSGGSVSTTGAQVVLQRILRGLLVVSPGRSSIPRINALLAELRQRQVSMLGAVFLRRSERASPPRWFRGADAETPSPVRPEGGSPVPSPLQRLGSYPGPGSSASLPETSRGPVDREGEEPAVPPPGEEWELGTELLAALRGADTGSAHQAVADCLVSMTEDMMNASAGHEDYSPELIGVVGETGYLPLHPAPGHTSVGAWIGRELSRHFDHATALAILSQIEGVLAAKDAVERSVDEWLADEFFSRHLSKTGGEALVWHLRSRGGACQVLIRADDFDHHRVGSMRDRLVEPLLAELERHLKAASTRGDLEQAALDEIRIADVRDFQSRLEEILGGGGGRGGGRASARVVKPSLGRQANLAALQRAGLLPFQVLSDEDLASATATSG